MLTLTITLTLNLILTLTLLLTLTNPNPNTNPLNSYNAFPTPASKLLSSPWKKFDRRCAALQMRRITKYPYDYVIRFLYCVTYARTQTGSSLV